MSGAPYRRLVPTHWLEKWPKYQAFQILRSHDTLSRQEFRDKKDDRQKLLDDMAEPYRVGPMHFSIMRNQGIKNVPILDPDPGKLSYDSSVVKDNEDFFSPKGAIITIDKSDGSTQEFEIFIVHYGPQDVNDEVKAVLTVEFAFLPEEFSLFEQLLRGLRENKVEFQSNILTPEKHELGSEKTLNLGPFLPSETKGSLGTSIDLLLPPPEADISQQSTLIVSSTTKKRKHANISECLSAQIQITVPEDDLEEELWNPKKDLE